MQQFVYFARDIQIVGPKLLREPEVEIIYRSKSDALLPERCSVEREHASFSAQCGKGKKMHYSHFLDGIRRLGEKVYPKAESPKAAFANLIYQRILPNASRRKPIAINKLLKSAEGALVCCWAELLIAWFVAVQALYKAFSSSLHHIFQYYATHAKEVACFALSFLTSVAHRATRPRTAVCRTTSRAATRRSSTRAPSTPRATP